MTGQDPTRIDHLASEAVDAGRAESASLIDEAGEPACWAHLLCPECGAVTTEGHRPDCGLAAFADNRE